MIECQDVSFSYPASTLPDSERQAGGALKHISCTIEDGSFVLLCGTSGCGKTTMTRLFNGLIPHYHEGTYTGSVYLDGKDTRDLSLFDISLKVGSVFQNPRSQFFNVDTTSELAFGPENHGIAEDLVRDRVKRVAAQLKLEPLLDRSIFSLSGGEKQKIACGSAAAIDPDIYVLDEPSSNLDAYAIADFRQLLFTDAQIDTEQNAASNAECIEAIFNRYVRSTEQTIFMSRCFSAEYNETENAIRRAINEINNEKKTGIMLIRVDEHHEGTTGQISDRIFRDIESAGLVIADLSSGKLNVPHEIGYAMGLKKDLILVHNGTSEEAEKHIPSNIRMFEQIRFNGDYQTLQNEIKRRLIDYYKL